MFGIVSVLISRVKESQAARLILIGLACLMAGAAGFAVTQKVSYGTALYWAITTATTVGYGDVTPKNSAGRVIAVAVMLTTIPLFASAFALMAGAVAASHMRKLLGIVHHEASGNEVIIFGLHPVVPRVAAELVEQGRKVIVVAAGDRSGLPEAAQVVAADPTEEHAVRRSHPERAGQVLIAGASDAEVLVTAVLVRQLAPDTPALAVAHSPSVSRALTDLGVGATVSADELLAHTLAKSLEAPHAAELLLRLVDSDGYQLNEVPLDEKWVGRPLSAARDEVRGLVLGAVHAGGVMLGVAQDPVLETGDRLLVLQADQSVRQSDRQP
ncbi:MAG: ion channel [Actinomycetota bacterium]|jgi:voltage-gated potassium channel|nr:ion channel [Actinomycetota bacterium]